MPTRSPRKVDAKVYNTRKVLVLDPSRFRTEMERRGADTDDQIAALLGTDRSTIRRIRIGETLPSNGFLAACVDADVDPMKFLAVQDRSPNVATTGRAA